jgi:ligand-binding sensor domain-containing protein
MMVIRRTAIFICAFLLCWHVFPMATGSEAYVFSRTSIEQGLSESIVNAIIQDEYGFLWFGTQDGLNKFDGYQFKVYKTRPGDSTSLSNNNILTALSGSVPVAVD